MKFITSIMISVGVLILAQPASASPIIDRADGLASPDVLIDFGSLLFPEGTDITDQFLADGVTFGANYQYDNNTTASPAAFLGLLSSKLEIQPGPIFFTSDVSDAIFSFRTPDGGSTVFESYLDGILVEIFTAATSDDAPANSGRFYGFENIVFDEIRFTLTNINTAFTLDNLQYNFANFASVPEPSTLTLFATGLVGLGFMMRRPRRNT